MLEAAELVGDPTPTSREIAGEPAEHASQARFRAVPMSSVSRQTEYCLPYQPARTPGTRLPWKPPRSTET